MPAKTENFAVSFGLPFRFTEDCDLVQDVDEGVIDSSIKLISYTGSGSIPLYSEFGCKIVGQLFDPMDGRTNLLIDNSLRGALTLLEPRISLDRQFTFDQNPDAHQIICSIPFLVLPTNRPVSANIVVKSA